MNLSTWLDLKLRFGPESLVVVDRLDRYPVDPTRLLNRLLAECRALEIAIDDLMNEPPIRRMERPVDPIERPYDVEGVLKGHPKHGA
jgi:hypothetical protein